MTQRLDLAHDPADGLSPDYEGAALAALRDYEIAYGADNRDDESARQFLAEAAIYASLAARPRTLLQRVQALLS